MLGKEIYFDSQIHILLTSKLGVFSLAYWSMFLFFAGYKKQQKKSHNSVILNKSILEYIYFIIFA